MNQFDIALTGLPRSGKTTTCYLLNKLPDVVALDEPMEAFKLARWRFHFLICQRIEHFLAQSRQSISAQHAVISKHIGGEVLPKPDGLGRKVGSRGEIRVDKPLPPDFLLVINHGPAFTALLETLCKKIRTVAIIRHPLAILASWNGVRKVPFKIATGHAPAAERLDTTLRKNLARIDDTIERQIHLLGWFFHQYRAFLHENAILRYEDIISSGGRVLKLISPQACTLDLAFPGRETAPVCDTEPLRKIGRRLLETNGPYWSFYSRQSVEQLLEHSLCGKNV
jgi:hypothetical protein